MHDFLDPFVDGLITLNTVMLGGLLALFRPGPNGYFSGYGTGVGWLLCFGASVGFAALALIQAPALISIAIWFMVALTVFGLTFRQALKLNIAQGLIYLTLVFGVVAASS